jgi:dihydroneopterin aldolase
VSSDKILLEGIRLEIRVGTTEQERSQPQLCGLDLMLETDLSVAAKSGELAKAVDYVAVFRTVEALCTENSFCLLEELAEKICHTLLADYAIRKVRLRVRKLNPFTPKLNAVGVEMKRSRKHPKKQH